MKLKKIVCLMMLSSLLLCVSGCSEKDTAASDTSSGNQTEIGGSKGDYETLEENTKTGLDFSEIDGLGNNLANLARGNHGLTQKCQIAFDDQYIYYDYDTAAFPTGLWRMKRDGSGNELYIPGFYGENFNIADGILYYSRYISDLKTNVIETVDLTTKETNTIFQVGSYILQMVLVKDKIFMTLRLDTGDICVNMISLDGEEIKAQIYETNNLVAKDMLINLMDITTDGENVYFFEKDGGRLCVYEMNIEETVHPYMELRSVVELQGLPSFGNAYYSFVFGNNGFFVSKLCDGGDFKYEAMLYEDMGEDLKIGNWIELGVYNTLDEPSEISGIDGKWPKVVLGNNLFYIHEGNPSSYAAKDAVTSVYFMEDLDVSKPSCIYTFNVEDFVIGGVYENELYLIMRVNDEMKLTKISRDGEIF